MVTALLAARAGTRFKAHRSGNDVAEGRLAEVPVTLARPRAYMNLSGRPVAALTAFYKVPPDRLVVIHDELDLSFGRLQRKKGGGTGGHNGLESIVEQLGTTDFARLRFGIGKPQGPNAKERVVGHVLHDFSSEEKEALPPLLDRAVDMARAWLTLGLAEAMNRHNRR